MKQSLGRALNRLTSHGSSIVKQTARTEQSAESSILKVVKDAIGGSNPVTSESAIKGMNESLQGSGVFIRALKHQDSEVARLCPNFIPDMLSSYVVPDQKGASASLFVSGVRQTTHGFNPYLIFNDLSASQVTTVADRDLMHVKSAIHFGPGYEPSLTEAKEKLAEYIRVRGGDPQVSGAFFTFSGVNESVINYGQNDIRGVGIYRALNETETEELERVVTTGKLDEQTSESVRNFIGIVYLASRLEETTGRPIPVVVRETPDQFEPVEISEATRKAIKVLPQEPQYMATVTVICKMVAAPVRMIQEAMATPEWKD